VKTLVLFRGIPGCGKTTLAKQLCDCVVAADDYPSLYDDNGVFHPELLSEAHKWCKETTEGYMLNGYVKIGVHNTFTQTWEMDAYIDLAKKHGYTVFSVIVENRHGNPSVHNVPEKTLDSMRQRFDISLG